MVSRNMKQLEYEYKGRLIEKAINKQKEAKRKQKESKDRAEVREAERWIAEEQRQSEMRKQQEENKPDNAGLDDDNRYADEVSQKKIDDEKERLEEEYQQRIKDTGPVDLRGIDSMEGEIRQGSTECPVRELKESDEIADEDIKQSKKERTDKLDKLEQNPETTDILHENGEKAGTLVDSGWDMKCDDMHGEADEKRIAQEMVSRGAERGFTEMEFKGSDEFVSEAYKQCLDSGIEPLATNEQQEKILKEVQDSRNESASAKGTQKESDKGASEVSYDVPEKLDFKAVREQKRESNSEREKHGQS